MLTVDQLCQYIGIKNPSDRSTCIGYGQAKPTCGNPVAERFRLEARAALQNICYLLDASGSITEELADELESVAVLLHCKKNHRYQAPAKANDWIRRLEDILVQTDAERHQRETRARVEPPPEDSNTQGASHVVVCRGMASHTVEDLLAELARRLASSNQLVSGTQAVLEAHSRTYQQPPHSTLSYQEHPLAATNAPVTNFADDEYSGYYSQDDTDDEHAPPEYSSRYQPPERARSSTPQPHMQPRSAHSPSPTTSSSSARSSHSSDSSRDECAICLSEFGRGSETWRCETCRNATHMDCFIQWMASSPEDNVRCIYCRSPVRTHD
ncbi:hypothetical protein EDD37DRAFT_648380 [Exophiala viscosa]|uniref:uncharacterized protein n=1 Tax=Exophiala viscosa TaxID=2486360 RepID=UPI00219FC501|nr:hypothetical protein EDD37DRAFT_648380 [Exophiala viscosa]